MMRRRLIMLLGQVAEDDGDTEKLLDIETARIEVESWRGVKYNIGNGELTITNGSYTWTSVKVFLDNCSIGKEYALTFYARTGRSNVPSCQLGDINIIPKTSGEYYIEFNCNKESPILYLFWSNGSVETIPITYYDFILEAI